MKCKKHTLEAGIRGCGCEMRDISSCVICGRSMPAFRLHVDTCGDRCFRRLCVLQRAAVRA